jgi:hypothetical protein
MTFFFRHRAPLIRRGEGWYSEGGVLPPEAGARHGGTLEAVRSCPAWSSFLEGG